MCFVYQADGDAAAVWASIFAARRPDLGFHVWPATGDPTAVRYLASQLPSRDISDRFPNLEVIFLTTAGVDRIDFSTVPASVSLVRMVEPGIRKAMVEYVTMATLALHRGMPAYVHQQREGEWLPQPLRLAPQRRIGVLGLGDLARAVLEALLHLGFDCAGWSRSRHAIDGVQCFAGPSELPALLQRSDILVCLLPLTPDTRGLLDHTLFACLPRGASLINVGRGGHLRERDLLDALDEGQLDAAILDVCAPEPLPAGHAFWRHPRIWVTPHVASRTNPETAARVVLDNLARHTAGLAMVGTVDRSRGY